MMLSKKNQHTVHYSWSASAPQASAIEVTVKRGDVSEEAAVKAFAKDFAKGLRWALPQSKILTELKAIKPLFPCSE